MDVTVTDLRAHLSEWLHRAQAGDEVVVIQRGVPVARIVGIDAPTALERLTAVGAIRAPASAVRPRATGRRRIRATRPVSDRLSEQRR